MRIRLLPVGVALASCTAATAPHTAPVPSPSPAAFNLGRGGQARQLLNRLTFGPRPGDIAAVEEMGVGRWLEWQLHPEKVSDGATEGLLAQLETQHKQPFELLADHPTPQELNPRLAVRRLADGTEIRPTARDSAVYRQAVQIANALSSQRGREESTDALPAGAACAACRRRVRTSGLSAAMSRIMARRPIPDGP